MKRPPVQERILANLAQTIETPASRKLLWRRVLRAVRITLWSATLVYLILLLLLSIAMHWRAERNVTLAFLIFLPAQTWLLPAPPLILCTLPFSLRLAVFQILATGAFVLFYMDYQGAAPARPFVPGSLCVLSYNRGQHLNQSLQTFKDEVKPDIVALQEASGRAPLYAKATGYAEFPHVDGIGEFVLLSKHPIINRRLISFTNGPRLASVAARFEVDFAGTPIAIYVVHLPTVRETLAYYRKGPFLYGIIGIPGTGLGEKRMANQRFWDNRVSLASQLADTIADEKLPCLAVGDFNMPDHGVIYHLFERRLEDAHEIAGGGFGFTFPGQTGNPLTLWGPWLRLDYTFCGSHWETVKFETEKHRTSQHRAVAGTFSLKSP